VRTTPFGSAVAPEVKMISAVVSPPMSPLVEPVASAFRRNISASVQIGRVSPSGSTSTVSPTRIAFASTMPATLRRKSADAR
jgi:hypothetical protein